MGTFNDPNQYAFYLFCMILLISLYACNYGDRTAPIYYCLGVFFMSISKSTGIFLRFDVVYSRNGDMVLCKI